MDIVRPLLMSWFCTLLSAATTELPIRTAGPWVVFHPAGGVTVGMEFAGRLRAEHLRLIQLRVPDDVDGGPRVLDLKPRLQACRRPLQAPSSLVSFRLGKAEALYPRLLVWLGGRDRVPLTVPRPPPAEYEARLVLLGAGNYPTRDRLQDLARELGGPLQLGILTGDDWEGVLGHGDWEHELPLLVLSPDMDGDGPRAELRRRLTGHSGETPAWVDWGALGLPVIGEGDDPVERINARDGRWVLPLYLRGPWDLHLLAHPATWRAERIKSGIRAGLGRRMPLILGGSLRGGFISVPLVVDGHDNLVPRTRGIRYLSACPDGAPLAVLPSAVACSLPRPMLVGLRADARKLDLVVYDGRTEGADRHLSYTEDDGPTATPAWGAAKTDIVPLLRRWRSSEGAGAAPAPETEEPDGDGEADDRWRDAEPAELLARLAWAADLRPVYGMVDESDLKVLLAAEDPSAHLLLLRLTASHHLLAHAWVLDGDAPPVGHLRHDLILRQLLAGDYLHESTLRRLMRRCSDPRLARAILAAAKRRRDPALLDCMLERLQGQAAGELPLADSPLDQHRLVSAFFDSPFVSPTPLRAIAAPLRQRLAPAARLPIDRFLERTADR